MLRPSARDRYRAARIGIVFQTFNLLPAFTALENVMLGMTFSGRGVEQSFARDLLQKVGLGHRLHHSPKRLSVGEQQRVAVARALANRPKLLLADEPTANVDPGNQQRIIDLIRQSCEADKIALLEDEASSDEDRAQAEVELETIESGPESFRVTNLWAVRRPAAFKSNQPAAPAPLAPAA